jgi:hypothetical protein
VHHRAQIALFGAGLRIMPANQAGAHSGGREHALSDLAFTQRDAVY